MHEESNNSALLITSQLMLPYSKEITMLMIVFCWISSMCWKDSIKNNSALFRTFEFLWDNIWIILICLALSM